MFLRSRGNVRDVQAHLEVSYPTARARLIEVLDRLGLNEAPSAAGAAAAQESAPATPGQAPAEILADLAAGRLDVTAAEALLGEAVIGRIGRDRVQCRQALRPPGTTASTSRTSIRR